MGHVGRRVANVREVARKLKRLGTDGGSNGRDWGRTSKVLLKRGRTLEA